MNLQAIVLTTGAATGWVAGAFSGIDPAWIALIGTLFGGVILKITEKFLSGSKEKRDDAKEIRVELRATVTDQKKEIQDLEDDVNEWRSKYYDLRDSYAKVQTELTIALANIKSTALEAESTLETHKDTPA